MVGAVLSGEAGVAVELPVENGLVSENQFSKKKCI